MTGDGVGADFDVEPVPVFAWTIVSGDPTGELVYYYTTNPTQPPSFVAAPTPSFQAVSADAPGSVPVYLYTILMADPPGTQVYYYSTSATTPPSFASGGPVFYGYASEQDGSVPVYIFTKIAGDSSGTQLYYYSSADDQPPGYAKGTVAFWAEPAPTSKTKIVVLSDVHIGGGSPTSPWVWYQPEVHDPYLEGVCAWIVDNAAEIQEMVLLGDIADQWTVPCDEVPPTFQEIASTNQQIFGPSGFFGRVLDALEGNVTYVPGNHDMFVTEQDLRQYFVSAGTYSPKFCEGVYLPDMPQGGQRKIALAHGNEYTMFNAVDPNSPWNGLPVGHFVTRMVASQMKRYFADHPGTVANLAGQGSPDGLDYWSIAWGAFTRLDISVSTALLDSVASQTSTPPDQNFILADGSAVPLSQIEPAYVNLFTEWASKEGGGPLGAQIAWKSVLADARSYYMGWWAQRAAFDAGAEVIVFGHTHTPQLGLDTTMITYANSGFECPSVPDSPPQAITFVVIDTATLEVTVMQAANGGATIAPINVGPVEVVPNVEGIPPDDSCYVKLVNSGSEDLILQSATVDSGYFASSPPDTIPAGQFGLIWLQDLALHAGSSGSVSYQPRNGAQVQQYEFACPYTLLFSNSCSGGSSFRTKSGTDDWGPPGHVATSGHPFYVEFTSGP